MAGRLTSQVTSISADRISPGPSAVGAPEVSGVLIDRSFNVVRFLGSTSAYLNLPPGKPSFNLIVMARPGLGRILRGAVKRVLLHGWPVREKGQCVGADGGFCHVNIDIQQAPAEEGHESLFRVVFERTAAGNRDSHASQTQEHREKGEEKFFGAVRAKSVGGQSESPRQYLESIIEEHQALVKTLRDSYADSSVSRRELETAHAEAEAVNAELEAANVELEEATRDLEIRAAELRQALGQRDQALRERQRIEAKMLQAQKLESLGVLAGGIAHDFNNLLVSVVGNASVLLDELEQESPLRPLADDILHAGHRAAELVDQILAYSGKGRSGNQSLDLSVIVAEMTHLLKVAISKKVTFDCRLAENLPAVEGDGTQIRQVVMNLITNAAEAIGDDPGLIRISTGVVEARRSDFAETWLADDLPEGCYVFCDIADNGCGMDEKTKARIFDPFFSTKFKGRGLGLAAVLGIVRSHHGAIKVESTLNYGTTFRLLFPGCEGSVPESRDEIAAAAPLGRTGVVLVVDDEPSVLRLAELALQRAGFTVLTASDGVQAVDLFREHSGEMAAVLLDLTMPQMDGREVLREIRELRPDTPVILSSGYSEKAANERFHSEGAVTFLQKPYRPGQLLNKVREVLGGATVSFVCSAVLF